MDISMSEKELGEFLSQPIIARISTVGEDSSSYIAPIWFIHEDGAVVMSTGKDSAKVKNIRGNPNVAVAIDITEGGLKSKGVIFRGKAELIDKNTSEITKRIYRKYMGSLEHPMVKQLLNLPRVVVRLKPQRTVSWDYAKMGG